MYTLEGASRWNMGRAKEAVAVEGASTLRTFNVQLMSHLNNMSQQVLGCAVVPEFTPPGKPAGERIAVEYLLVQTNRGDLLAPKQMAEIPSQLLEDDEDELDATVCMPAELRAGDPDPPSAVEDQTGQCDLRGVVGWEAADALAAYLVGLNWTITAFSVKEEAYIIHLYKSLHAMDKAPLRLYMTHGQAAQDPELHRVSECVCLRLTKEFEQARNRPKDTRGKIMPIPQSIVSIYSHIKQLLEDSRLFLDQTNLVLVP
ncbi:hypothetical protein INR49_011432, partial [Caranx melampygus]